MSRRRLVLGLVAGAVLLWGAAVVVLLLGAQREVRAGLDSMRAAQAASSPKELLEGRPLEPLEAGGRAFARAERRLESVLLAPLRVLPIAGRQVRSAGALSGAAADVADVGADVVRDARRVLRQPHGTGPERIAMLREMARLAGDAERRLRDLDLGPARALVDPLAERRAEFVGRLDDLRSSLRDGRVVAGGLADLLQGPRRYLVLAANNSEMRAGSGMFLSVGELGFADGSFELGAFRPTGDLYIHGAPPPITDADYRERWGWLNPNREWRNLGASPRFDATAELATRMWVATGGAPVDGVLALDPVALRAVLRATGPVRVADREVNADNVLDLLLHDQYVDIRSQADRAQAGRRELLGLIAKAVVDNLQRGGWETATLASELADAARGRHLLAWSSEAATQEAWQRARVDGRLHEDSLFLSLLNRGGNKLDHFMRLDARLDVRPSGDETEVVVQVNLANRTPEGESLYIAGPFPGSDAGAGEYVGLLSLNAPGWAGGLTADVEPPAASGADGPTRVHAVPVTVPRGETRTVVFRFRVAARHAAFTVEPVARVPALTWVRPQGPWPSDERRRIDW
jgi:predicted transcriptional regulator